jgi:hypothetical protein
MGDVECPYCGSDQEINHDDGYGYREDVLHEQICGSCDKTFTFTTSIMYHYEAYKAPCLNGEDHSWKPTMTVPRCFTRMRCRTCEEERQPTPEEKIEFDIPEKEM